MEGRRMTTGAETVVETKDKNTWDLYGPAQRRTFLFILFLTGTANYADRNVIGVLLEPIKAEFGVSDTMRSEEHTSELQSLMRNSYAVFCLKKKTKIKQGQVSIKTHKTRN